MIQIIGFTKEEFTDLVRDVVKSSMTADNKQSVLKPRIKGIHALAEFLGVSPPRAQKLKNEGVFPYFKDGRLVLFDPEKVQEAMEAYNRKGKRGRNG